MRRLRGLRLFIGDWRFRLSLSLGFILLRLLWRFRLLRLLGFFLGRLRLLLLRLLRLGNSLLLNRLCRFGFLPTLGLILRLTAL